MPVWGSNPAAFATSACAPILRRTRPQSSPLPLTVTRSTWAWPCSPLCQLCSCHLRSRQEMTFPATIDLHDCHATRWPNRPAGRSRSSPYAPIKRNIPCSVASTECLRESTGNPRKQSASRGHIAKPLSRLRRGLQAMSETTSVTRDGDCISCHRREVASILPGLPSATHEPRDARKGFASVNLINRPPIRAVLRPSPSASHCAFTIRFRSSTPRPRCG